MNWSLNLLDVFSTCYTFVILLQNGLFQITNCPQVWKLFELNNAWQAPALWGFFAA